MLRVKCRQPVLESVVIYIRYLAICLPSSDIHRNVQTDWLSELFAKRQQSKIVLVFFFVYIWALISPRSIFVHLDHTIGQCLLFLKNQLISA